MRAPELCIECGQAGFVRREQLIKGSRTLISCHCTRCGRRWETIDQRRAVPHQLDAPRERRTHPR